MINMIKKFYLKHYLKIVSVFFAFVFWSIADNTYNGKKDETISVDITFENLDVLRNHDYILENELELREKKAQVIIRLGALDLQHFKTKAHEMKAVLDLRPVVSSYITEYEGEKIPVFLDIILPEPYDQSIIQNPSSQVVEVQLGKYVEIEKEIRLEKSVVVPDGYESDVDIIDPEIVTIVGPKSYVDIIGRVVVDVENDDITSDTSVVCPIEVYDTEDRDITSYLELYPKEATVNISVYKSSKLTINNPTYVGNVADGYAIKEVNFEPKSVTVLVKEKDLKSLKNIDLETIDISNANETIVKEFRIADYIENKDVQIKYNSSKDVIVTIEIEKIKQKDISLPYGDLTIIHPKNEGYSPRISEEAINFKVFGIESLIDSIDDSKLEMVLDISNLEPGSHSVPLKILNLPNGINIMGENPTIDVDILEMLE